uniref:O-antigen ligase n=1 Tax=viral metagenome TaxID=1070528 RepID=A0A6M3IWS1_9ZZZZ
MFNILLGVFLFLSPVIFVFGNNAKVNGIIGGLQYYQFGTLALSSNIVQLQFFEYGIIVLFITALTTKSLRDFKDKWLALFLGLCAISVVLHPKTQVTFLIVALGILLYYLVVKYSKNINKLLYVIVFISTLNTIFAVLQFFNIHLIYKSAGNITGLMFSSSHLGTYQALAVPIFYALNPILTIIPVIGLILAKSFTPLLALIIGLIYLFYPRRKEIFVNIAPMGWTIILGVTIFFILRNYHLMFYKLGLRLELWFSILKDIAHSPFGHGLGAFSRVSVLGQWNWIYNEYLGIAYSIGILSLPIIYIFLKNKFTGAKNKLARSVSASCLIAAIICLGQSAMSFPRLAGTIIILFGFMEILKRKENY